MLNELKRMIILASPERILLDFEAAAINAFGSAFPSETVNELLFSFDKKCYAKS